MTYSGDVILNEATLALYVSAVRISTIILEALTALRPHRGACVAQGIITNCVRWVEKTPSKE